MSDASSAAELVDGLSDQSYEIQDELKIRKILEAETDWSFEFTKNGQYAYDLVITEWDDKPRSASDNQILGYVELERSRRDKEHSWITGDIPDSWTFYSFLRRKIHEYDYDRGCWSGLKENYHKTVYLKFNHALDNCFAAAVPVIYREGRTTPYSDGTPKNSYLALGLDRPEVRVGIDNCVAFIEDYLTQFGPDQTTLLEEWNADD